MVVTLRAKGRVFVPAEIRRKLDLRQGAELSVTLEGGRVILRPLTGDPVEDGFGMLAGEPSLVDVLLEERRKEMERDDPCFRFSAKKKNRK